MAPGTSGQTDPPTELLLDPPARSQAKARVLGIDVARGVALLAMLAANNFPVLGDDGRPTLAALTVTGRSASLFVMVAGVSLAFLSGGRWRLHGPARRAAAAGIAVRALLIGGVIGLPLGYVAGDLSVILPYYGLFFLLAIPLLGLRPRTLLLIAGALVVVGPLIKLASFRLDLDGAFDTLTLSSPFTDPVGFVTQLFLTGDFPAVTYLTYLCVGLAIGRLDLSSTKVASRLLGGGLALAVFSWFTSSLILFRLDGLQHLAAAGAGAGATSPARAVDQILWDLDSSPSWWWLATRSHHSGTPIDLLHTAGCAMAVIGAALLVTRLPAAARLLGPIAVAGSMTLTIYSAHAAVLNWDAVDLGDVTWFLLQVGVAVAFAVVWRRFQAQGPLERLVATAATRARRAVSPTPARGADSTA